MPLQAPHQWRTPGNFGLDTTIERQVFAEHPLTHWHQGMVIGSARDSGNSPATLLRPGLLMGQISASGKWKEWNPTGTDGSEICKGVLIRDPAMQIAATNVDRWVAAILTSGFVKAADLLVPGTASHTIVGNAHEHTVRRQMKMRGFLFDDEYDGSVDTVGHLALGLPLVEEEVADDVTVVAADHGREFVVVGATAAVTFTLPTITGSLAFRFRNRSAQNMIIKSAAGDDISTTGDDAADDVSFDLGNQIGAAVDVYCNRDKDRWYVNFLNVGEGYTVNT